MRVSKAKHVPAVPAVAWPFPAAAAWMLSLCHKDAPCLAAL